MNPRILVVDIETTGTDPQKHSIVSIGAVHPASSEEFYIECRMLPDREVMDAALMVNGFTREQCNDESKTTAQNAYFKFLTWAKYMHPKPLLAGQNIGSFDSKFLENLHNLTTNEKWPFGYRSIDLHSLSFAVSGESLTLDEAGISIGLGPEQKPHNALNGAKYSAMVLQAMLKASKLNTSTPSDDDESRLKDQYAGQALNGFLAKGASIDNAVHWSWLAAEKMLNKRQERK
mgnify:CR=1 FL=1